jgi:hypothetical protein
MANAGTLLATDPVIEFGIISCKINSPLVCFDSKSIV